MLFDLLSTDVYVSYNSDLAHIVGLQAAVYISELININRKALKKNKLKNNYFIVDRSYIEQRTTLKEQEQLDLDKCLCEVGILKIGESKHSLQVDMDALTGIMLEPNKDIVSKASAIVKRGRPTKQEQITRNLKLNIKTENNELKEAYSNWVDSVIARQGWMSKEAILEGQSIIDEFTNRDLDLALELLKIASIGGYRDLNWAINDYKKNHKISIPVYNKPQPNRVQLADEVF